MQALGQQPGERRHVELHEARQFRVEHALERVAQRRVIAPDREHAVAAQQVEIFRALAVEQILPGAAAEADIVAQRLQHAHHLLVEVARVHGKAIRFAVGVELRNIQAHGMPHLGIRSAMTASSRSALSRASRRTAACEAVAASILRDTVLRTAPQDEVCGKFHLFQLVVHGTIPQGWFRSPNA